MAFTALTLVASCGSSSSPELSEIQLTGTASPTTAETAGLVLVADSTYARARVDDRPDRTIDVYGPGTSSGVAVLLLHGGGASNDDPDVVEVATALAKTGHLVFVPTHGAAGASPEMLTSERGRRMAEAFQTVECSLRYLVQHAAGLGGDLSQVVILGHSAGGFLGLHRAIGGEGLESRWRGYLAAAGIDPIVDCVADAALPEIDGFVGFNGAYFVFQRSGLDEAAPELWALADPRQTATSAVPDLVFIIGSEDEQTPQWHDDETASFARELERGGSTAELVVVEGARHGWSATDVVMNAIEDAVNRVTS